MIDPNNKKLSVRRQCILAGLPRASYYYKPVRAGEGEYRLKRLIDEIYTKHPFYGVRRVVAALRRKHDLYINKKRIRRLMREMGIRAIYPKPKTSIRNTAHKIYPYLLKGMSITRPNQVWCTDITYIRLKHGFCYLVAIMDWYSRYVLSWRLSNTMNEAFCVEALKEAIDQYGKPEIFNTDQGSQFTGKAFTTVLKDKKIRISMDGRGCYFDNIFVERLWRSVKQECIYIHDYESLIDTRTGLERYFRFYNEERPHQGLDNAYPAEKYFSERKEKKSCGSQESGSNILTDVQGWIRGGVSALMPGLYLPSKGDQPGGSAPQGPLLRRVLPRPLNYPGSIPPYFVPDLV